MKRTLFVLTASLFLADAASAQLPRTAIDLVSVSGLASADFDGDGVLDLVGLANTVASVRFGESVASWPTMLQVALSNFPVAHSLATGDFDADGRADLAVRMTNGQILIAREFDRVGAPTTDQLVVAGLGTLHAADINSDGFDDLCASTPGGFSVWRAVGGGAWSAPTTYAPGGAHEVIAVRQADGQIGVDVLTVDAITNTLHVFSGDNAGGFSANAVSSSTLGVVGGLKAPRACDVDHNGIADVVGVSADVPAASLAFVQLGSSNGTFSVPTTVGAVSFGEQAQVVDWNDDRLDDVFVTSTTSGLNRVWLATSTGFAASSIDFPAWPLGARFVDLDGDTMPEAVHSHATVQTVIRRGLGRDGVELVRRSSAANTVRLGIAADLNDDGFADVLTNAQQGPNSFVQAFLSDGTGGFAAGFTIPGSQSARGVRAADVDGDGVLDAIWWATIKTRWAKGFGDGTFAAAIEIGLAGGPGDVGDIDNDGDRDVVMADYDTAQLRVFLNDGNGVFSGPFASNLTVGNIADLRLADIDSDGYLDAVFGGAPVGSWIMSLGVSRRIPTNTHLFELPVFHTLGASLQALDLADVDKDGDLDVLTATDLASQPIQVRTNDAGVLSAPTSVPIPYQIEFNNAAFTDVDLDGEIDIVGDTWRESFFLRRQNGAFEDVQHSAQHFSVLADLDGDGDRDMVYLSGYLLEVAPLRHARETSSFCFANTLTQTCVPVIETSGVPSVANAQPFVITAAPLPGQRMGLVIYGSNAQRKPFHDAGLLCVAPPVRRLPLQLGFGTPGACDGALSYDFGARIAAGLDPALLPGEFVVVQAWYREPALGFGAAFSTAAAFTVQP